MPPMPLLSAALALAVIVLLIFASGRLARRLTSRMASLPPSRRDRLSVGPAIAVDAKRRLVLLRCDATEFAVLLGPAGDTVLGVIPAPHRDDTRSVEP